MIITLGLSICILKPDPRVTPSRKPSKPPPHLELDVLLCPPTPCPSTDLLTVLPVLELCASPHLEVLLHESEAGIFWLLTLYLELYIGHGTCLLYV